MNIQLHADGFAAKNVIPGSTAFVLVLSGTKPEKMITNIFVLSVASV